MDAAAPENDGGIDISEDDETTATTRPILDTIHEQQQQHATSIVTTTQHLSGTVTPRPYGASLEFQGI